MPQQTCAHAYKGIAETVGNAHIVADLADDRLGRGITAVGGDGLNVGRQGKRRCHQHGCRAHRNAAQEDFNFLAKAIYTVVDPIQAIVFFFYAKGNGISVAFPVGALVNDQKIVSDIACDLGTAARIAQRIASPTVKQDLHTVAVRKSVVFAYKLQAVA